jgi:hypothetical protein
VTAVRASNHLNTHDARTKYRPVKVLRQQQVASPSYDEQRLGKGQQRLELSLAADFNKAVAASLYTKRVMP